MRIDNHIEMSINKQEFKNLREKYPSWLEMKAHFESEEGGKLRLVEQGAHAVVRYEKNGIAAAAPVADAIFRSVVWDISANLPLCVAPFRANEGLPPVNTVFSAVEEFVDGFMVNAWVSGGELHISTRTRIGGENKFYSNKTFGQMFAECVKTSTLKNMETLKAELERLRADVNGNSAFVSFVVQHPEHRIVAKVSTPGLFAIHTGYVLQDGTVNVSERSVHWPQALARLQVPAYTRRVFKTEGEVEEFLRETAAEHGWRWQGLVFKNGSGTRWRMRTPTYTMLRQLRGTESTPLERFFRLRVSHQVVDYLKHYGEERDQFWEFEQTLRARTADILAAYTDAHKAHVVEFKDLPDALKPAVYLLHLKWRDELRSKGFSVRLQNVISVVNKMRGFEKQRLMGAAPYVAVSPHVVVVGEEVVV
jgi:hypothetical protein